jgi:transposase
LSLRTLHLIEGLAQDWHPLDKRIEALSSEIGALACKDPACDRFMSVPGIGPIISSAMVAAIGSGDVFSNGRDFAAWLGLVPKQISTGDRTILGSISKRGNRYLRAFCSLDRVGQSWAKALGALRAQILDRSSANAVAP